MSTKFEKFTKESIDLGSQTTIKGGWEWPKIPYIYTELEPIPEEPIDFVYNP